MPTPIAPRTNFIFVDGVAVATRAVGAGRRLMLLHRFRGTLDDWDPALVSAVAAAGHEVFMFDSLGVGQTGGVTPDSVEGMADFAARVIKGERVGPVDILGWSLGGFVAQVLAVKYPEAVRSLVLAGTMPSGEVPGLVWDSDWLERASSPFPSAENALALLYGDSDASRQAGRESRARMTEPPTAFVTAKSIATQGHAIRRFADGDEHGWYARLENITIPAFVASGDRDGLFPAIDSVALARAIPDSQLRVYPDSGHAFLFQYAERFADDLSRFLRKAIRREVATVTPSSLDDPL